MGLLKENARAWLSGHKWVFLTFALLGLWQAVLLGTWLAADARPAQWDQSVHLSTALSYKQALADGRFADLFRARPAPGHPPYPPLVHFAMVPLLSLAETLDVSPEDAATWVNYLFLMLIAWGAWLLAADWWDQERALAAALMTGLLTPALYYAREPLVDLGLAAFVVLSYAFWERSYHFYRLGWTLAFGVAVGLGTMAKWTCPLYLFPLFWDGARVLWRWRRERASAINALAAFALAALICAPWHVMNLLVVLPRISRAAGQGGREGDPAVWSLDSWLWYPALAWNELYPWGALLGLVGLVWAAVIMPRGAIVLMGWLFSSYVVWSLVSNKNPRYIFPAWPVLSLAAASLPLRIPWAGAAAALFLSGWCAWAPASRFARPPVAEPWPLEEMVRRAAELRDGQSGSLSVLTLVSNHAYLNGNNLRWTVEKLGLDGRLAPRTKLTRLGELAEFVLIKTGDLGPAYAVDRQAAAREEALRPDGWFQRAFSLRERWPLPDGGEALLFHMKKTEAQAPPPADVLAALFPGVEAEGLALETPAPGRVRLAAQKITIKGLALSGVRLELEGFQSVRDDEGRQRLLRLSSLKLESAALSERDAEAFLMKRIRNLKQAEIRFDPAGAVEARLRLGPVPLSLRAGLALDPSPAALRVRLEKLRVAGVPLPLFLAGPLREKALPLAANQSLPFPIALRGLRVVQDAGAPARLQVGD